MELFAKYSQDVLQARRRQSTPWADFRCRAHSDRSASASIDVESGFVKCHASICNWEGWIDEYATECRLPKPPDKPGWEDGKPVGLKVSTPLAGAKPRSSLSHYYNDAEGNPYMRVRRIDLDNGRKTYPQSAWIDGKWADHLPKDFARILYRLPELLAYRGGEVYIVEGEKSVECLRKLGLIATTAPGGAEKAHMVEDWTPIEGKDAVIIADNDIPGQRHARQVAGLLIGIAKSIRIMTMPDVPEKGDVVDWVDAGGDIYRLRDLVDSTPAFGAQVPQDQLPATKSREYIERSYVCSAMSHKAAAQKLVTFHEKRWKDPACKLAARALKQILDANEEPAPWRLSQIFAAQGKIELFDQLKAFAESSTEDSDSFRRATFSNFREATNVDDLEAFLSQEVAQLGKSSFKQTAVRIFEKAGTLVRRLGAQSKLKTLGQHMLEYLDKLDSGEAEQSRIRLKLLDPITGPFGGGDAVYICGGPKVGKTGFLMQLLRDAAQTGHKCLLLQLELRLEQVLEREGSYMLGKRLSDTTAEERNALRHGPLINQLDNIIIGPKSTSIDECREVMAEAFGQYPDIEIFGIDYNEMLQDFSGKTDQLTQTEAVSDFVKKSATIYGKLGILLAQPKEEYYKDCRVNNKPLVTHWKRGSKMRQDAQALCFLHCPNNFDDGKPENLIELHVQLCRDAPGGMMPLMVDRKSFIYSPWPKDEPIPEGKPQQHKPHAPRRTDSGRDRIDHKTVAANGGWEEMELEDDTMEEIKQWKI